MKGGINIAKQKIDDTIQAELPDEVIRSLARAIFPTIIECYHDEEFQQEFREWLAHRERRETE
ncbi:MAG: hypothetical protein VB121_05195 [Enterococcus thailandicus]|nr:hypothetical protein [Enterococcus thailandicus]